MSRKSARRELDRLYADLPALDCQGRCAESCGPIAMSRVEWERLVEVAGHPVQTTIDCPLLENERCTVYAVRPLICRLWGLVESMPCPWGCKPTRYLTDHEGYQFLERAEALGA
jgi:hypothetical protein